MRSNLPEAKNEDRGTDSLADNGDGVATITDLTSWRIAKQSLRRYSGDYRKPVRKRHQQTRSGGFTGTYRLFSNFFQN